MVRRKKDKNIENIVNQAPNEHTGSEPSKRVGRTIRIDPDLWIDFGYKVKKNGESRPAVLEKLIRTYLETR